MSNKIDKPMMTSEQLIAKMRDEKGITFKYTSEEKAKTYLTDINNYLRTAAYRQNYQKHTCGKNKGKYIKLDFAYLQEMSTVDMHFRFIVNRMCLDIEQALKVKLIRDVSKEMGQRIIIVCWQTYRMEPLYRHVRLRTMLKRWDL